MLNYLPVVLKQLPPSPAALHLLDIGAGMAWLEGAREDIAYHAAGLAPTTWPSAAYDALTAYDRLPTEAWLRPALGLLRPGGRLVVVLPTGKLDAAWVTLLEQVGYVRILAEALDEGGLLLRGERAHTTADTLARVRVASDHDDDEQTLANLRGRYVHLLIRLTPNLPPWRMSADVVQRWDAVGLAPDTLLAFSSLPKAVSFLQAAVLADVLRDVHKVAKFSRAMAQTWPQACLINPTLERVRGHALMWWPIDPASAETPDE